VTSHPRAFAQCERFFAGNPRLKRTGGRDTAGSGREGNDGARQIGQSGESRDAGRGAYGA